MFETLPTAYASAPRRLFLLDYDGTLVDIQPTPAAAKPTPRSLQVLKVLAVDPRNTVVVVSGRDKATLQSWLGDLPIHLVAEHGSFAKQPSGSWQAIASFNPSWKTVALPLLRQTAAATPQSFVEEKETALVWHYRLADAKLGQTEATHLVAKLRSTAEDGLSITQGQKIVEIRPVHSNKGAAVASVLQQAWDFILAAGDDVTDEDLFAALPSSAVSVKIGPGSTKAAQRLPSPAALLDLLESLSNA